jgi:DNA-directed RNA polymerases I, II, and III subunit RPABC1
MSLINKLNTSRSVILDMLEKRGYSTEKYREFTINEIEKMYNLHLSSKTILGPLDMTIKNETSTLYIKYILNMKIRITNIVNLINDLTDNLLINNDTLILLTNDKIVNSTLDELLESIYQKNNIFIQIFNIDSVMIDITKHIFVPKHELIDQEEKEELFNKYNLTSYTQLPLITKDDPVCKYHGGKRNDIFKIINNSETSGIYISYRLVQ